MGKDSGEKKDSGKGRDSGLPGTSRKPDKGIKWDGGVTKRESVVDTIPPPKPKVKGK